MTSSRRAQLWRVIDHDFSAAITLMVGVAAAVLWSSLSPSYFRILLTKSSSRLLNDFSVNSFHDVVINALMAIFFYALGLELARELRSDRIARARHAIAPVLGAMGGMLVTALGSLVVGTLVHSGALRRGWGVPMATDVAFTLGVLAIAGRHLDPAIRVFLLTLAITDDVLSVIALGVSGASHLRISGLLGAAAVTVVGALWSRRVRRAEFNVALFAALWLCFSWANVEPALSGVLAGVLITADPRTSAKLERVSTRLSIAVVLPLFALAACGVHWPRLHLGGVVTTVVIATILIRLFGKTLGVTLGVATARALGYRAHPSITWPLVVNLGLICAIGFTVPLLFAAKLFGDHSSLYAGYTLGLLTSSVVAALLGGVLLRGQRRAE